MQAKRRGNQYSCSDNIKSSLFAINRSDAQNDHRFVYACIASKSHQCSGFGVSLNKERKPMENERDDAVDLTLRSETRLNLR